MNSRKIIMVSNIYVYISFISIITQFFFINYKIKILNEDFV